MKHTPGPWYVVNEPIDNPYWLGNGTEVSSNYGRIADCNANGLRGLDEGLANAKLIAAAPELLEALKEITEAFEGRCADWENPEFNDCYNKARAAIAKAES